MKLILSFFVSLFALSTVAFADPPNYSYRLPLNDNVRGKAIRVPTGPEVKKCADLKMKRDGSFVPACSDKDKIRKQLHDAVTREVGNE